METAVTGHNGGPKNSDWIAVYRGMRTHPIVGFLNPDGTRRKNAVVCETMAWVDLCMQANWKDLKEDNKGRVVLVERGQLQGGRAWLAERWGWTEKKVRHFLAKLTRAEMVILGPAKGPKKANTVNIITICNYNIYQTASELIEMMDGQQKGQQGASEGPHYNKGTRKQEEREDSVPDGTGPDGPIELTAKDRIWGAGIDWLRSKSCVPEAKLRTRVGRWCKDYGDEAVLDVLVKAHGAKPGEPLSWIEKVLLADDNANQDVTRKNDGRIVAMNGFSVELEKILDGGSVQTALDRIAGRIPVGVRGVELLTKVRSLVVDLVEKQKEQDRRYAAGVSASSRDRQRSNRKKAVEEMSTDEYRVHLERGGV